MRDSVASLMKRILVPTDFSAVAYNALAYACGLAKATRAEIVLLNCYQLPASYSNILIDLRDILEKDSLDGLNMTLNQISREEPCQGVTITPQSYYGFLVEGVNEVAAQFDIDLVIMGTTGANTLIRRFFGSNTSQVLKRIDRPVLAVPANVKWRGWENTVFATDFVKNHSAQTYQNLMNLASGVPVHLDVLHVITEQENQTNFERYESNFIADTENPQVDFHYIAGNSISEGILSYIESHPCNLLVMLRREHSLMEQIFNRSSTRSMSLLSPKPLLLLRE